MSAKRRPVAVVTGGSRGIGKATRELLARRGARAVGLSRHATVSGTMLGCDVRDEASVKQAFARVLKQFGRIDILVNAAGVVATTGPLEVSTREWDEILRTNLIGSYWCCREALLAMRRQRSGSIVNISSIAGRRFSRSASVAYVCSKYAVIGLTRQLAAHAATFGARVNCVCPSETATEMLLANVPAAHRRDMAAANPMGRLAKPEEIARAIAFLASDEASYLNGAVVDINGGLL